MGEVIAIMNQKGGCGKTTTTVNLATSLAVMGKTVLIIDLDPQANATTSFGIEKTELENTIYDALIGDISIKKATIPTFIKNLFIVPSNISLSGVGMELSRKENYHIILKKTIRSAITIIRRLSVSCLISTKLIIKPIRQPPIIASAFLIIGSTTLFISIPLPA